MIRDSYNPCVRATPPSPGVGQSPTQSAPRADSPRLTLISGSPRAHGNTAALATLLRTEAETRGATVTPFSVATNTFAPCRGCHACVRTGECVQHDDSQTLHEALATSDALIWVAPLYFASIPAQLKALIDRMMVLWARNNPPGQAPRPLVCSNRPASAFLIAGGDDPFKTDAATVPLRYAGNVAGYTLRKPLGVIGPNQADDILLPEYAAFRAIALQEVKDLLDATAAL